MARGRAVGIVLEAAEKSELTALTRKHGAPQALAERARIVLAAAEGLNNKEIADKIGVCAATAGTWRNRFAERRIDGLYDEPRPGAPREIGDDEIAATIRKTLETRPKGATHWSLRTLAKEIGHAASTVHRIWRAFGLQPHRVETFKLSSDPLFVEKVRDIVGLYLSPPERALCYVSTRNRRCRRSTAHSRCCRCGPVRPNGVRTITSGTERHLCSRLSTSRPEPLSANAWPGTAQRNSASSLTKSSVTCPPISTFMSSWTTMARTRPSSFAIGSPSAHAGTYISRRHQPHGSTRSIFALLTERALTRGVFRSLAELEKAIKAYIETTNADPKPFRWTKTANDILASIQRFCLRTLAVNA
jgi:transposase